MDPSLRRSDYSLVSSERNSKLEIDDVENPERYNGPSTSASAELGDPESFQSRKQTRLDIFLTDVRWGAVVGLQLLVLLILLFSQRRIFKDRRSSLADALRVETGDDVNNLYQTG